MKKANSFQIEKVQPQAVAELLLEFLKISAGVSYNKTCLIKFVFAIWHCEIDHVSLLIKIYSAKYFSFSLTVY